MSYGLIYRPAGLYTGPASTPAASSTSAVTATTTTEKAKLEANETVLSVRTAKVPENVTVSVVSASKTISSNTSLNSNQKYAEPDILPWLMQPAANPRYKSSRQYQVTEDAEAEG